MKSYRVFFLYVLAVLAVFFVWTNHTRAAEIQRVGIQVADEGCAAFPGTARFSASAGEWSEWAGAKKDTGPYDCARIFLAGNPTLSSARSDNLHRTDGRACVQLADENSAAQGEHICTPWASEIARTRTRGNTQSGGGWSAWAESRGREDPESVRIVFEERPLAQFPDAVIQDVRLGIQLADNGCADIGNPVYTPWVSAGGGWSAWAYDANAFRPDCMRIELESTLVPGPLEASCAASAGRVAAGERVIWTVRSHGGSGRYSYLWSGTDQLISQSPSASKSSHSVQRTYRSKGVKSAQVQVSSGSKRITVLCPSVIVTDAEQQSAISASSQTGEPQTPQAARQPLSVACSGAPAVVRVREAVAWRAYVSGGIGIYSYRWIDQTSGARIRETSGQKNQESAPWVYANGGVKAAEVTVSSGVETSRCSASITVLKPLRGVLSGSVAVHRITKNGALLSQSDGMEAILRRSDRLGSPVSERKNPSQFSQTSEGEYVIEVSKRSGVSSAAEVGQCWYALGDAACAVADFDIASCGQDSCTYRIKVISGYVTKVAFRYDEPPAGVSNAVPSVKNLAVCGGGIQTNGPSPRDICPAAAFGESPAGACTLPLRPIFSWAYEDADENTAQQSHYQIRILGEPERETVFDTGKVRSSSRQYIVPPALLAYGREYQWDVTVWDSQDAPSASRLLGPLFTTQPHQAPSPIYSWEPFRPKHAEETTFTDRSEAFGGAEISSRQWRFQGAAPSSSALSNPVVTFAEAGIKTTSFVVRDSDGLSCGIEQDVPVEVPSLPEFREVFAPLRENRGRRPPLIEIQKENRVRPQNDE